MSNFIDSTISQTALTPLESERRGHEAFASTRRRAYVENQKILDRLDHYVEEGAWQEQGRTVSATHTPRLLPLVITGESGSGKSALLSHWSNRYQKEHPESIIITHYIGATASSSDHINLLRRVMWEIQEQVGISEQLPTDPEQIVRQFPEWLTYTKGYTFVLIVDALNQLEGSADQLFPLDWLPEDFPPHTRLIISTLDGPQLKQIRKRAWPEVEVAPLTENERREVARRFLGDLSQRFNTAQVRRVAGNRSSANPLYLRTSLEELRALSRRDEAEAKIDYYLEAENLGGLFQRVLERIEGEFGSRRIREILRSLWGSRYGLSKEELTTLHNTTHEQLSPILGALDYHLMQRDGLYTFFHEHLRTAVAERYVKTETLKRNTHRRLAEFFAEQPATDRRVEEEPWQWEQGKEPERLQHCLTDLPLFCTLFSGEKKHEAFRYWQVAEKNENASLEKIYATQLESLEERGELTPLQEAEMLETVGAFLFQAAEFGGAERFYRRALELREGSDEAEEENIARTMTKLGETLSAQGMYEEAESTLQRALQIIERVYGENHTETAIVLDALATLLYSTRNYDKAEPLFVRTLSIRERSIGRDKSDSIMSLVNLGALYFGQEKWKEASSMFETALERSERAIGNDHPLTAMILNNMAVVLQSEKDYEGAIPLLERAMEVNQGIYGSNHPEIAVNLSNLAYFEKLAKRLESAATHSQQALVITEHIFGEDHPNVARCLINLGTILIEQQNLDAAEKMYRKALSIRKRAFQPDHISIHICNLNLARVLSEKGEIEEAISIYRTSIPIVEARLGVDNRDVRNWQKRFHEAVHTWEKKIQA
ncbi:MAG: tetratricopeptide repeat protein [Ignavibacteriae bacterium]|nr:tetratricopeptide repeat protein [Ignavibacteriota bacterium]MCB9215100.1 tetratricopeptide repeat protein [Ignavibacteria bacterium]